MIRVGVIGYGYWGPNVVRNFNTIEGSMVVSVCDLNPEMLTKAKRAFPQITVTSDPEAFLAAPDIDAVAVVTPVSTHFELARKALLQGKHVFVEKPFTQTVAQAEALIELGERKNLRIMVDHTFLFHSAVRKINELIREGTLGRLYYFDSARVNLGLFQHDINVVWDLAPHDLSIMDYLINEKPTAILATGVSHFNGLEDVAYITVYFPGKMIAHLNVNWLSPVKVRMTFIGGEKRMLVWNDLETDEKLRVYDKGVEVTNQESIHDLLVSYRSGDMWVPKIEQTEALKSEAEYFADCVVNSKNPINDGKAGLRVVKLLEAANESLKNKGEIVLL